MSTTFIARVIPPVPHQVALSFTFFHFIHYADDRCRFDHFQKNLQNQFTEAWRSQPNQTLFLDDLRSSIIHIKFHSDQEIMSDVFERYERQYCEISANLSKKCTAAAALDGERKKQKVSEIQTGLDEAESLIRKMDLEARSLQPNVKAVLLAKLREYKSDLNNLKSEAKRLVSGNLNATARDELLESGMADALTASADQRSRLMMSTERVNQSTDRIKDSRRTMLETEELGVSILQDLSSQRQSLLHAHNTLHGVDDNVGKSKKVLTAMSRRMSRNKWIIGTVVAVLVIAIILILYFKLAK